MKTKLAHTLRVGVAAAALTFCAGAATAAPQMQWTQGQLQGAALAPRLAAKAQDLGAAPARTQFTATVHLPMPNEDAFEKAVNDRYDRKSPMFHKWMSNSELSDFGLSQDDRRAMKKALQKQGLTVTDVDDTGTSYDVSGDATALNRAFGAQMHAFRLDGQTVLANVAPVFRFAPELDGKVRSVTGLNGARMQPMIKFATDGEGKRPKGVSPQDASPLDSFSNQCFSAGQVLALTDGTKTTTVTAGASYAFNGKLCGYTPAQMNAHYGIDQLHSQGIDGTGQTIVIVDAFGYPNARSDANTFFAQTGLTPFDATNFKTITPFGAPAFNLNWAGESALDIQWAHAIAPGAKVILAESVDNYDNNLQRMIRYAVHANLGNVISNSYGLDEQSEDPASLQVYDEIGRHAAAKGISVNFSTGDSGDYGYTTDISGSSPATARWVTAVGGTSLDVPNGSGATETGWGNYRAQLGYDGQPVIPPIQQGFYSGAGGGGSAYMKAPKWDRDLGFKMRQTPDLAMDADPYTGAIVVEPTSDSMSTFSSIGGTSLACPMFSALWALADQQAGFDASTSSYTPGSSLGLAAVLAPQMAASGALVDVAPLSGQPTLTADFTDANGTTTKDGFQILGIANDPGAVTVLRLRTDNGYSVLSFNTDSKLAVAPGWDNVTGRGVPNAPALKAFVDSISQPPSP